MKNKNCCTLSHTQSAILNFKQKPNKQVVGACYQVPEVSLLLPDRRHPEIEMHELPNNISGCDRTSQQLKNNFICKEQSGSDSSLKVTPEEEVTITQTEVHSNSSHSQWAMHNSSIQCNHSSATDISISSDGSAHEFPLTECQFEEPKLHSEAGSTHSSEIERQIMRINEEYEKCDGVYKSQRIDQEAFTHVERRYMRNHIQPCNVRNDFAKHLLTESMHSVRCAHPRIPLATREEAIKFCSTEVLVSKSSAESLSDPEMNANRSTKTNHNSANFKDKETCQKGFTEIVKTRSTEVSPMTRGRKCQWPHFGPGGVNPDPIPLSSETDCVAFCDVHNFVLPNISFTAATSHSFFPPKTNSEGNSLNSSELNLRLKGINQESDGCSSS